MAEEYVNFLVSCSVVPKAMTLEEIQQATAEDATLQCLADMIRTQNWDLDNLSQEVNRAALTSYRRVKEELTVNDRSNVVLHDSRIVITTVLQERAISLAHEGHQGLVKMKQLLREKVWFPGIDETTKRLIDKCVACQANGPENRSDALHVQMSPLPPHSWYTLHMDFCGPFPTGEYICL